MREILFGGKQADGMCVALNGAAIRRPERRPTPNE